MARTIGCTCSTWPDRSVSHNSWQARFPIALTDSYRLTA